MKYICLLALLLVGCGGGSSDKFDVSLEGEWGGELKQAAVLCPAVARNTPIFACTGCTIRDEVYQIIGGASPGDAVSVTTSQGCILSGVRDQERFLEVFPDMQSNCRQFLEIVSFEFTSDNSADVFESSAAPNGDMGLGQQITCSLSANAKVERLP